MLKGQLNCVLAATETIALIVLRRTCGLHMKVGDAIFSSECFTKGLSPNEPISLPTQYSPTRLL